MSRATTREVAAVFARLGVTAFGGPVAHIAMMRDETVVRRKWLDEREFLDMVAACNLLPGPSSTELAAALGRRRAGWPGFAVAGAAFVLPAVAIVMALAWAYERYGTTAAAVDLSYGILPVVVGVVAHAAVGLARAATDTWQRRSPLVIAAVAATAWAAGLGELPILAAAALVGAATAVRRPEGLGVVLLPALPAATGVDSVETWRLAWAFIRVGALLFGSGYMLVGFLERDLVATLGWLTERQLLDAVAIGQVTPGPLFTTATFVGYQVGGIAGGLVATVAIFTPGFIAVAVADRFLPRVRTSPTASAALDAIVAASLGLMSAALARIAATALTDWLTWCIGIASAGVLLWRKPNTAWLVAAGAAIGLAHGALT